MLPARRPHKALSTLGLSVAALGLACFLSALASFALHFGDFTNFDAFAGSFVLRLVGGMIGMIAGGMLAVMSRILAVRQSLGSVRQALGDLDPETARRALEPWARLEGGLERARLEEMGIDVPRVVNSLAGSRTVSGET